MAEPGGTVAGARRSTQLERSSFVPLYYQLQEILKQRIESGVWKPGDAIPSEPELCREFGVSRIVVRQALAILEDDHQIDRIRGRGTFVAQPKIDYRASGLARLLSAPRGEIAIGVLDRRRLAVEDSIRTALEADPDEEILRVTTMLSFREKPVAITYSYFRAEEVPWLEKLAAVGRTLPADVDLEQHGIRLLHSELSIETSQCGQFEADRFGIEHRAAVFLVLCREYREVDGAPRPFEVARAEYRGDLVQFRLEVSPGAPQQLAATLALVENGGR